MKNKGITILSLGPGVVSIFFSFLPELWWVSLILAISGLIMGIVSKIKIRKLLEENSGNKLVNTGVVLSIITIILNMIAYVSSKLFLGVIS